MKIPAPIWLPLLLLVLVMIGCNKASGPTGTSSSETEGKRSTGTSVLQAALSNWEQGDKETAVSNFVEASWGARPLFPPGSALNLSEEEFRARIQALASPEAVARMGSNLMAEVQPLKTLAGAVAQSGANAVAQQNYDRAREHLEALRQCGQALDTADSLAILRLLGQGFKKRADAEMEKLPH
jgi:hypothetical protein